MDRVTFQIMIIHSVQEFMDCMKDDLVKCATKVFEK